MQKSWRSIEAILVFGVINRINIFYYLLVLYLLLLSSCVTNQPQVVVITSTMEVDSLPTISIQPSIIPTEKKISLIQTEQPSHNIHIVQPGENLSTIADIYNISVDSLIYFNDVIDPNYLEIGQIIKLPEAPDISTPSRIIMDDSYFIRSIKSADFNLDIFLNRQSRFINQVTDQVITYVSNGTPITSNLNASDIVERVSIEYSIDARLLLALLEYKSQWLTLAESSEANTDFPLITQDKSNGINRKGLYRQLSWAANQLNYGYYGWKYKDLNILTFDNGIQLLLSPDLNAASVAIQYFFSLNADYAQWETDILESGFYLTYKNLFEDPTAEVIMTIPTDLNQPELNLPFRRGDVWYFTGGFHGGWGSGSAWAALDFVPPDDITNKPACYISEFPVTAVASGIVTRNENGMIILDLDMDGNELTGWSIMYLHITPHEDLIVGAKVNSEDILGYASCYGGIANTTHLHIARKYNGEWIPAYCSDCNIPHFEMSDWQSVGLYNQEYQGLLFNPELNVEVIAEQSRSITSNRISLPIQN